MNSRSEAQIDDAHPLDWYPSPDDDPRGVPAEAAEAWVGDEGSESLRSIARRLESSTWHPSKDLAISLVRAASTALANAERPAQMADIRKDLLRAQRLFKLCGARHIETNLLVVQRVLTEWELGRILIEETNNGRLGKGRGRSNVIQDQISLREIGVTHHQSSRFQKVASIDLEDLEDWMSGVVNDPDVELSTRVVLEVLWREQKRERTTAARVKVAEAVVPETVHLEVADARTLPLDNAVIDLTFTSPPYGLDIAYEGGDLSADAWHDFMGEWMTEVYRVTKPSGRLAVNVPLDTRRPYPRPTYAETIWAGLAAGWDYQFTITWDEGNTSTGNRSLGSVNSSARPVHVSPVEMIAVFSKGEWAPSFDGKDDILPDEWQAWGREVWRLPGESSGFEDHPAPFPEALARRVIQYLSPIGASVLDPFSGSGTTITVASRHGRKAFGFDVVPEYIESARRRVAG